MKPTNANRSVEAILRAEAVARASGRWRPWRFHDFPAGSVPFSKGWAAEITRAAENGVFSVLIRETVVDGWGPVTHAILRTASNATNITWAEKQRIKDEVFGRERTAIEVFPPRSELVDEANSYHLCVFPAGFSLPFSIGRSASPAPLPADAPSARLAAEADPAHAFVTLPGEAAAIVNPPREGSPM